MVRTMALAILLASGFVAHASSEQPSSKGDPLKGKVIAETVCIACHTADGNSVIPANPKLAGQIEDYLFKQLKSFKAVDGKPAARVNPLMAGMTAALSEDDMRNLAAWFSTQKQNPAAAKDLQLIAAGQKLWRQGDHKKGVAACSGCHGPAGAGLPFQFPRLSGQFPEYIEVQLKAFRQGERANDPESMMRNIAAKLSDRDIKAVAEYAAGLR